MKLKGFTKFFRGERQFALGVILIVAAATYLGLKGLDSTAFWDDEAHVGIVARNLLKTGRLTGWDGRNLCAFRNAALLDRDLRITNPPLEFLVAGASFKMLGPSTWSGRLPFVFIGLGALALFIYAACREFGKGPATVFSAGLLAFSVVFLLNIRQCRYYALSLFCSILVFCAYRRFMARPQWRHALLLAASAGMAFYSNYLLAVAFLAALLLSHFVFHAKDLDLRGWAKLLFSAALFGLVTVPYAIQHRIWHRADLPVTEPWYVRRPKLIWWNFRELNLLNILPWTILLAMLVAVVIYWKKRREVHRMVEWLMLGLFYVFFLALLSPQATANTKVATVRYLIPALPFLTAAVGGFLALLNRRSKAAACSVFVLLITCNVLSLSPFNPRFRWFLPAYVEEVHSPYPTAYGEVVAFLASHAAQDDTVFAFPCHTNVPLMFYLGSKIKICCALTKDTHLPLNVIRRLNAPLLRHENFPDWFVAFGKGGAAPSFTFFSRPHVVNGRVVTHRYELASALDVFCCDTHRPELTWHTFGPKTSFDRESEGVYVFKRVQCPGTWWK